MEASYQRQLTIDMKGSVQNGVLEEPLYEGSILQIPALSRECNFVTTDLCIGFRTVLTM